MRKNVTIMVVVAVGLSAAGCIGEGSESLDEEGSDDSASAADDSQTEPIAESESPLLVAGSSVKFECQGNIPGNRWLDGRTVQADVKLAPNTSYPYTGTHWLVSDLGGGEFAFMCQGNIPGNRWLKCNSGSSTGVSLAANTSYTGTHWRVYDLGAGRVGIACQDSYAGPYHWLDGRTANSTVGLAPNLYPPYTGAYWKIYQ